jgi:hypothetical protein
MAKYVSIPPKKPKKSKVLIFLNIVIGILTAAVILRLAVFFLSDYGRSSYYNRSFGDFSTMYALERSEYAELVDEYYGDRGVLGRINDGYEDAAAVAEYADAAFRYGAYMESGDTQRAQRQKERMDKAAEKAGIYGPELEKIDGRLDLEK